VIEKEALPISYRHTFQSLERVIIWEPYAYSTLEDHSSKLSYDSSRIEIQKIEGRFTPRNIPVVLRTIADNNRSWRLHIKYSDGAENGSNKEENLNEIVMNVMSDTKGEKL